MTRYTTQWKAVPKAGCHTRFFVYICTEPPVLINSSNIMASLFPNCMRISVHHQFDKFVSRRPGESALFPTSTAIT